MTVKLSFCNMFPGFTFGSADERGDYPSADLACATLEQYRQAFAIWLDVYHNTVHDSLHMTPAQMRARLVENSLPAERYCLEELNQLCLSTWRLKLDKGRVLKFGLKWCGDGVAEVRQRLGKDQTAIVRFNPCDLGKVWVSHPDTPDEWHEAEGTRLDYQAGLSLSEHQFIRSKLRERSDSSFNPDMACIMLLGLNELIEEYKKENQKKGLLPTKKTHPHASDRSTKTSSDTEATLNDQLPLNTTHFKENISASTGFGTYHLSDPHQEDEHKD